MSKGHSSSRIYESFTDLHNETPPENESKPRGATRRTIYQIKSKDSKSENWLQKDLYRYLSYTITVNLLRKTSPGWGRVRIPHTQTTNRQGILRPGVDSPSRHPNRSSLSDFTPFPVSPHPISPVVVVLE